MSAGVMPKTPTETLNQIFGFKDFRPYQQEIIETLIDGHDLFVNAHRRRKIPLLSDPRPAPAGRSHRGIPIDLADERSG